MKKINLSEQIERIRNMMGILKEEHQQDIDEVSWMTDKFEKIRDNQIPLTPTVVKMILGNPKRVQTFHVTDETHVDEIKKIIGKRNPVSTFQYFSEDKLIALSGIKTKGGVVLKIEGTLDFASSSDIYSTVDESLNRRWINAKLLSKQLSIDLMNEFRNVDIEESMISIKKFINRLYELIEKYKNEIQSNLLNIIVNQNYLFGEWNELLVRNIRVISIAWTPTRIFSECRTTQKSEKCQILINEFEQKLKQLSNDITTLNNSNEAIEWFKENGGFTKINDFKTDYLKNFDRNDLFKTNDGIRYLISNSDDKEEIINKILSNDYLFDNLDDNTFNLCLVHITDKDKFIYKLLGTQKLLYILTYFTLKYVLTKVTDKNKFIDLLSLNNKFIGKLDIEKFNLLMDFKDDKQDLINKLLSNQDFINNLKFSMMTKILDITNEPEYFINILLNNKLNIDITEYSILTRILGFSKKPENVINKIMTNISNDNEYDALISNIIGHEKILNLFLCNRIFIHKMTENTISFILERNENPENIIKLLGLKGKEFIKKLDFNSFYFIFINSQKKSKILKMLGEKGKELINQLNVRTTLDMIFDDYSLMDLVINLLNDDNLNSFISLIRNNYKIFQLLCISKKPQNFINILNKKGIDYIQSLNQNDIEELLDPYNTFNPTEIKNILKQHGRI